MSSENYPAGPPRVLTPAEVEARWRELGWGDKASYDAGVVAERERCAAIADAEADRWLDDPAIGACRNIAAKIRKARP